MALPSRLRANTKIAATAARKLNVSLVFAVGFGVLMPLLFFCSLPFLPAGTAVNALDGARASASANATSNATLPSPKPSFLAYVQGSNVAALAVIASLGWVFNLIVLAHHDASDKSDDEVLLFARRKFIRISLAASLKCILAVTWVVFSALPLPFAGPNVSLLLRVCVCVCVCVCVRVSARARECEITQLTHAKEVVFSLCFQIGTSGSLFILLFVQCWNCPRCRRRLGGYGPFFLLIAGFLLRNCEFGQSERDNPNRKRNETHEALLAHARRCAPPRRVGQGTRAGTTLPIWANCSQHLPCGSRRSW